MAQSGFLWESCADGSTGFGEWTCLAEINIPISWKYSKDVFVNAGINDRRWMFEYSLFCVLCCLLRAMNSERSLDSKTGVSGQKNQELWWTGENVEYSFNFSVLK